MDPQGISSTHLQKAEGTATRASLILRLHDTNDQEAWFEFERIYRQTIAAMARYQGLREADIEDLIQTVMLSIARAIETFEFDTHRAKFRTWLKTIARNAIINSLTRTGIVNAAGDSNAHELLEQAVADNQQTRKLEWEYRRQVFEQAARELCSHTDSEQWQCFWETAVEGRPASDVAKELGRSLTSVYAARSRILKRLRQRVAVLDIETNAPVRGCV